MPEPLPAINTLIPHQEPMVLLDRIREISATHIRTETIYRNGHHIAEADGVHSTWALEIVSQACAAFIGYHYKSKAYSSGRLIKVQSWQANACKLPLDTPLFATAAIKTASEIGLYVFHGSLLNTSGNALATGQLSILAS